MEVVLKVDYAMHSTTLSPDFTHTELNGLAMYLVRDGWLDANTAAHATQTAQQQGVSFTHYLVKTNTLSSQIILHCCEKYFELPFFDLKNYDMATLHESLIPSELIDRYHVIPIHKDEHCVALGMSDPTNHAAITAVSFHTGLRVRPMLVSESELDDIINLNTQVSSLGSQLEAALARISPPEDPLPPSELTEQDEGPISEFVDHLIQDAIEKNVSDIHIEPHAEGCRIRFRRDGLLSEAAKIPSHLAIRVITRLKILSQLNIAERRLPQDGRISLPQLSHIDIRVSTCPLIFGEKIVLRLLDGKKANHDLNTIGLTPAQKALFISLLTRPQGLILVTGPTGSGKTITLYAALHYLNQAEKNISSVEDPVEIELMGINQININPRIGLDFASVMRALLRQDPDIIMVGEIRDAETTQMAMQAAQTGHLVLSTLHTNSAVETIFRLQSLGASSHHFISSVSLIIAQRLVRKLCSHCRQPEILPLHLHESHITYRAKSCEHCCHGYKGRIGIFEFIPITEKIAQGITTNASAAQLLEHIKQEEIMLLWDAGLEKLRNGITSYTELMRVVGYPY